MCIDQDPPRLISSDLIVWNNRDASRLRIACRCGHCGGEGQLPDGTDEGVACRPCGGVGWFGIDPLVPTTAPPGTLEKVAVLCARCAAGIPLWHGDDCDVAPSPAECGTPVDRRCASSWTSFEEADEMLDEWDSEENEQASDLFAASHDGTRMEHG